MSPTELEAIGRVSSKATTVSSFVLLDETPWDTISKEKHQQIEAKKLQIENKMTDIKLSLSKQFDTCTSSEEQKNLWYIFSL